LIAGGLALAVIGLLVAKPWQPQGPGAISTPGLGSVVGQVSPTAPGVTPEPGSSLPAVQSTDGDAGVFGAEINPLGDLAQCLYEQDGRRRPELSAIVVPPPLAYAASDAGTGRRRDVAWSVELLSNHQQSLFTASWTSLGISLMQFSNAVDGASADFSTSTLVVDPSTFDNTTVVRVRIIVEWYSPGLEVIARSEIVLPSYIAGEGSSAPPLFHCPAVLDRR
jgi:hypothetical protein